MRLTATPMMVRWVAKPAGVRVGMGVCLPVFVLRSEASAVGCCAMGLLQDIKP